MISIYIFLFEFLVFIPHAAEIMYFYVDNAKLLGVKKQLCISLSFFLHCKLVCFQILFFITEKAFYTFIQADNVSEAGSNTVESYSRGEGLRLYV